MIQVMLSNNKHIIKKNIKFECFIIYVFLFMFDLTATI